MSKTIYKSGSSNSDQVTKRIQVLRACDNFNERTSMEIINVNVGVLFDKNVWTRTCGSDTHQQVREVESSGDWTHG